MRSNRGRYFISRFLKLSKSILRVAYNILHSWDRAIGLGFDEDIHNYLVRRAAKTYDMMDAPDETYYARHYGDFIEEKLVLNGLSSQATLLDLACGQGRIISELAGRDLHFKNIIGVDFSDDVLTRARMNLSRISADVNIKFESADLLDYVRTVEDKSIDVLLLLEVLYMVPDPEALLSEISRTLTSSGIAFFSVRTDYYYGLSALKQSLFNKLQEFEFSTASELFDSGVQLNWTNSERIFNDLASKYGLSVRGCTAIGSCSGIPGDPLESIVRPSELNSADQESLLKLEKFMGNKYPDSGRYLLFSAVRA